VDWLQDDNPVVITELKYCMAVELNLQCHLLLILKLLFFCCEV